MNYGLWGVIMLKANRFLKYWQGFFGVLREQAEDCKVYILGLNFPFKMTLTT
jgi:hypothetical protein